MTAEQQFKLEALKYAVYICNCKKSQFKMEAYNVACDEVKLSLEAAIERLEHGDEMESFAYTQDN